MLVLATLSTLSQRASKIDLGSPAAPKHLKQVEGCGYAVPMEGKVGWA